MFRFFPGCDVLLLCAILQSGLARSLPSCSKAGSGSGTSMRWGWCCHKIWKNHYQELIYFLSCQFMKCFYTFVS
jgi:hypothetical protein